MTAVTALKCKFKEVADPNTLIFYYGYLNWLLKGREDTFTVEDCKQMIENAASPNANDIVKYNGNESKKALNALDRYRSEHGL